jgi:conjugative transposon protein TcpC
MVRRSTVDRSPQPAVHTAGFDTETRDLAQGGDVTRQRAAQSWRGAGGRWLVWAFRAVLWAVLLIIGYRGVMAILLNEAPATSTPAPSAPPTSKFPAGLAGGFALQFSEVYLNANPADAGQRASELAQFLPADADTQLGWDGKGTLQLQSEQLAGVKIHNAHNAVVTVLARVNGNLMELGVPVYSTGGSMVVSGEPAWLPAPPRAAPPANPPAASDDAAQADLQNLLPQFFVAYANGNPVTLARFLVPGAKVTGLGDTLTYSSLSSVNVPPGGNTRQITATVVWRIPGAPVPAKPQSRHAQAAPPAGLEMTYGLTIVKQNGSWYVKSITPSTRPAGPP